METKFSVGKIILYIIPALMAYSVFTVYLDWKYDHVVEYVEASRRFPNLTAAAYMGDIDRVKELIKRGADVNERNGAPLEYASERGHVEVVRFLLGKGANPDGKVVQYRTPLIEASSEGHYKIVKMLISAGADVNAHIPDRLGGGSALNFAVLNGHHRIATLLLESGADPNISSAFGGRPLNLIAHTNKVLMAKILVDHGADIYSENKDGHTPVYIAAMRWKHRGWNEEMASYLLREYHRQEKIKGRSKVNPGESGAS